MDQNRPAGRRVASRTPQAFALSCLNECSKASAGDLPSALPFLPMPVKAQKEHENLGGCGVCRSSGSIAWAGGRVAGFDCCPSSCSPTCSAATLPATLLYSQTMGPPLDPLLAQLLPPSLSARIPPGKRKLLAPLLIALLLVRSSPFVDLVANVQIPGRESAERRRERKRIEALTPLTTPALEKESADLVRSHPLETALLATFLSDPWLSHVVAHSRLTLPCTWNHPFDKFVRDLDGKSRTLLVPFRGRVSKVRFWLLPHPDRRRPQADLPHQFVQPGQAPSNARLYVCQTRSLVPSDRSERQSGREWGVCEAIEGGDDDHPPTVRPSPLLVGLAPNLLCGPEADTRFLLSGVGGGAERR